MTGFLEILSAAPGISVQNLGTPGFLAYGLAPGGAADRRALWEAAALLGQPAPLQALEMPLRGGRFRVTRPTRIALTGAPMRATREGQALRWNASHRLAPGEVLEIGATEAGVYGYLSFAGGIALPETLGSHPTLAAGDALPLGADLTPEAPSLLLPPEQRFAGGVLRVLEGPQSALFDPETRARAFATAFTAGPGNRQGLALAHPGAPFATPTGALVSDFITPGDIQMTGAGHPVVLLAGCQTVGGYARLGTVLPIDLPRAAQAAPGSALRLQPVTRAEAELASPPEALWLAALRRALRPALRSPHDIPDLLGYQLISGAVRGDETPEEMR